MLVGTSLLGLASITRGLVYWGLGKTRPFEDDVADPVTGITMGIAFGLVVWLVGVVVVLPCGFASSSTPHRFRSSTGRACSDCSSTAASLERCIRS